MHGKARARLTTRGLPGLVAFPTVGNDESFEPLGLLRSGALGRLFTAFLPRSLAALLALPALGRLASPVAAEHK